MIPWNQIFVVEFELSLFDPFLIFGVVEFLASLVLLFDLFLGLLVCNGLNAHVPFMDSMVCKSSGYKKLGYKIYNNNIFIEILSVLYMVNCYNEVMYNGCAVNVTV
jgi:hypothetical protein